MGIATVPEVARFQKMKDGGLAVEAEDYDDGISFKEAWGAQRIDRFLRFYFPAALEHQDEKHDLHEGEFHWVPLSAERKKLIEFKKKDEINGKDLLKIKVGKGKEVRETTLYFGQVIPAAFTSCTDAIAQLFDSRSTTRFGPTAGVPIRATMNGRINPMGARQQRSQNYGVRVYPLALRPNLPVAKQNPQRRTNLTLTLA